MPTETPLSYALAMTLFHFLWQGALIAVGLAVALFVFRPASARVRYGLACSAMLAMLVLFGLTLAHEWPRATGTVSIRLEHPAWRNPLPPSALPSGMESVDQRPGPPLQWIVLLWILGVGVFALRSLMSWGAAQRLRRIGVCAAPDLWQDKVHQLADRLRLSKPVVLLESCLSEAPVVIGFLRPVILAPAGLLTGFPPEQLEYILIHELAHIRRYDYLVNLLQSFAEDLLFYHPAVWWVSGLVRAEREDCCDDVVVASRGDARGLAAALAALEHYRWTARETALAANGGHLMNRVRRLLEGREGPRMTAAPVFFAGLLLASAALSMAAVSKPAVEARPTQTPQMLPASPSVADPQIVPPAAKASAERRPPVLIAQAQSSPAPAPPVQPADSGSQTVTIPKIYNGKQKTFFFNRFEDFRVFQQAQTDQARQELLKELTIPGAYRKWLDEDVVYIINDEERKAFSRLQTDEERQAFIEQFWLRRDPTPGTEVNESKEELYRRIAYADQRFSEKGAPGWRADRGRIYIVFGPPDEIDSHGGTTSTFPFERWRYRYIEGIGNDVNIEFVDTTISGIYHMTMDPKEKDSLLNLPGAGLQRR